ncbi:MAG: LCP family protein [Actinobacteria bacterium]|nr:LCP family protein [Actinomycetota bacterium]
MTSTFGAGGGQLYDTSPRRLAGRRRHRTRRLLVVGVLLLSLLAVGAAAGYFAFLNWTVSKNLTYSELLPDEEILGENRPVQPEQVQRPESAGDARNFLLIGSDTRDPDLERGRSDVIVLAHVSDDRQRVDLIHFPRDYFVQIPGSDRKNKINAAYSFGGAPLLVETLQALLGVPIDEVALVDFESFKSMTDAIGGVQVNVAEGSPRFPAGMQQMDGATGLQFVRERYDLSQGDISRGQRQQAFIKAIMLKALSRDTLTNPSRFASFVDAATTNVTVDKDLDLGDMRSLALSMRGVRGDDIHFVTAPWTGIGDDSFAGSIINPAPDQLEVLGQHLQSDTMADYSDPVSPTSGFGR